MWYLLSDGRMVETLPLSSAMDDAGIIYELESIPELGKTRRALGRVIGYVDQRKPLNVDDTTPTVTAPVDANQDSTVSRQTSTTGGQKDQKLAQFSLIPPKVLYRLAEHYGKGAMKYAPDNWRRGYNWSLSYDALHRHLNAWWSGVDKDEEGNDHIIAALWHVVALAHWSDDEKLKEMFDNRPKSM